MEAPVRDNGPGRGDLAAALALAAIIGFVFRGGLANGLVGDDFSLINYCRLDGLAAVLRDFDPVREVWYYRPLTKIVFGFAYALWGTAPWPYHVVSLLAHAVASALVYFVARRAGASPIPAFVGTLLFAVHFRNHESVFWFSAISYPLSTCFGLASALLFRASLEEPRRGLLAGSLLASFAAMLTKDTAAVVPVLAALYGLLFAGGGFARATRRVRLRSLVPLGLVLLLGVALQAVPVEGRPFARGGAAFSPKGAHASLDFVERSAALAVPGLESLSEAPRQALALAAALGLAAYAVVRRSRLALFGLAWVVLAHLPFYAFVPRMGDLYLYLPLAGVALIAVDAAELSLSRVGSALPRAAAALAVGTLLVWSAARIDAQALRWRAAGDVVNGVVSAVKEARPSLPRGATLVLEGLPDRVGGVYAFNNAVPAVFWLAYADRTLDIVRPEPGGGPGDPAAPHFLYDGGRFYEVDGLGRRRLLRQFDEPD